LEKIRNIIVTGSTAGIGLAVAKEFLERGHNVFICGRQSNRLDAALEKLTTSFGKDRVSSTGTTNLTRFDLPLKEEKFELKKHL
jgi:short-subunit dehydrogenase